MQPIESIPAIGLVIGPFQSALRGNDLRPLSFRAATWLAGGLLCKDRDMRAVSRFAFLFFVAATPFAIAA